MQELLRIYTLSRKRLVMMLWTCVGHERNASPRRLAAKSWPSISQPCYCCTRVCIYLIVEGALQSLARKRSQLTYTLRLPESNYRERRDVGRRDADASGRNGRRTPYQRHSSNHQRRPIHTATARVDQLPSSMKRHGEERRRTPLATG